MENLLIKYILHLADNNLIMSQRLSEWTGHGPALEQDIALTNIALDNLGQSRNFYQHAASLINEKRCKEAFVPGQSYPIEEDDLAYHRLEHQFKTHLLLELPNEDWAQTILKVFFFSVYQQGLYTNLLQCPDSQLAAIAEKSLKEVKYHVKWSKDWVLRLGDGTAISHDRMEKALGNCWPFVDELFEQTEWNKAYVRHDEMQRSFTEAVKAILAEATLTIPNAPSFQKGGLQGKHTENMGYLLAEMQYLQRVFPNSQW